MKQGIVSEAYDNCSHCEGVACFALLVLPRKVRVDPRLVSASPHPLLPWGWLQLSISVKEGPLTWSWGLFGVLVSFFKPFHTDRSGEQLLGTTNRP